jgi:hypothetical protein
MKRFVDMWFRATGDEEVYGEGIGFEDSRKSAQNGTLHIFVAAPIEPVNDDKTWPGADESRAPRLKIYLREGPDYQYDD